MKHRIPCGGWCPEDRADKDGQIPDRYPLTPLKKGGPNQRTARNVQDSDGTIVIYFHELSGETAYTVGCCIEQRGATPVDRRGKIFTRGCGAVNGRTYARPRY